MSIETRASWGVAMAAVATLSVSFGSLFIVVVGLKTIAAEMGGQRSIPAFAHSLAWFSAALGGLYMTPLAERIGVRLTAMFGACMVAVGLVLSSQGEMWQLYLGHGLFIGLLGNAGINAPLYVYITRWFDVHRGAALALITSGQYVAGAIWPSIFERTIAWYGWRQTMFYYSFLVIAVVVPTAGIFFRRPPTAPAIAVAATTAPSVRGGSRPLGLGPNTLFACLAVANFTCCVPMAMPSAHLIALCGDLGMATSAGAAMLSVLLVCAMVSRQFWGWMSDRIGGLKTLLLCSAAQALAVTGFALTQDEVGLFAVAAGFGLGFSGLIPAYVLVVREMFPSSEASWRVPALLLCGGTGMAFGGWFAGFVYDKAGYYAPAFASGIAFNLINLAVVAFLVSRYRRNRVYGVAAAA